MLPRRDPSSSTLAVRMPSTIMSRRGSSRRRQRCRSKRNKVQASRQRVSARSPAKGARLMVRRARPADSVALGSRAVPELSAGPGLAKETDMRRLYWSRTVISILCWLLVAGAVRPDATFTYAPVGGIAMASDQQTLIVSVTSQAKLIYIDTLAEK